MNKKGFVFLETVAVLIVVMVCIAIVLASYSLIVRKSKEKLYYDKASDKYLIYALYNIGKDNNDNFDITKITSDTNYETLKQKTGLVNIHITDNIYTTLESSDVTDNYLNGTIEYMKTLQKCNSSLVNGVCEDPKEYIIGVFKRNEKYYYASIEI